MTIKLDLDTAEAQRWHDILSTSADKAMDSLGGIAHGSWGDDSGWGSDGTATVLADKIAEDAALGYLADTVKGVSVFSEEIGLVEGSSGTLIIVDPLDGTNNAVRGIPHWGYSAAVIIDDVPVGAYVRQASGLEFFAWRKGGAWCGESPAHCSPVTRIGDAAIALQRPVDPAAFDLFRSVLTSCKLPRMFGAAAIDLCYVGAGFLDGYLNVNANPLLPFGERVVDYAAAAIFIEAAGGMITDIAGNSVSYAPLAHQRSPLLAASTPQLHDELLRLVVSGGAL